MLKKKMLRKREGQNVSWFFLPSPHENPLHNIPFINMQHRSFFFKATGESCYVDRPWKKKKAMEGFHDPYQISSYML